VLHLDWLVLCAARNSPHVLIGGEVAVAEVELELWNIG
jgi:hypothetical protein